MSGIKALDEQTFVSGQISKLDVENAAQQGARIVICNRPDEEEAGQPSAETVRAWAEGCGIRFAHIPVAPGEITLEAAIAMGHALKDGIGDAGDGKVLAYCRSGGRSAALWALASTALGRHEPEDVLRLAHAAGYDLAQLKPAIQHMSGQAVG